MGECGGAKRSRGDGSLVRIDKMSEQSRARSGAGTPRRPGVRAATRSAAAILALVGSLLVPYGPVPVWAQDTTETDAPELARNVELIGRSDLGGRTNNAAVWGHRNFAYVGSSSTRGLATTCRGEGVAIVDVADPARPTLVGSLAERPGTSAEDVQVLTVFSGSFTGDLLATGLQRCGPDGVGGLSLWDVTDPRTPVELSLFETGAGPSGVHELRLVRRGQQTLALLAVPFSESLDAAGQGDVRIVDISDPRAPVQLADWGIARQFGADGLEGRGHDPLIYAHSVHASADGQRAYVSFWDAGVVILDLADLSAPRYLGRTTFDDGDEGNAHSVALARGGRILVQADEDRWVRTEAIRVEGSDFDGPIDAAFGVFRTLLPPEDLSAPAAYVGRGCPARPAPDGATIPADPYSTDPRARVAIVDRGECSFVDKAIRAQTAGAVALVVVNDATAPLSPDGDVQSVRIPVALIAAEAGARLKVALAAGPAPRLHFTMDGVRYDDWGYLRFWDVSNPANPVQLSTFATEHARTDRETGPPDDGWYTAHHPVALGDRLYVSWYADGVRILDMSDPTRPREVGFFVPTPSASIAPIDAPSATPAAAAAPTVPATSTTAAAPALPAAQATPTTPALATAPANPAADPAPAAQVAGSPPTPRAAEPSQSPRRGSVWGVYPRGELILVSDEGLGLFILRDRTR